MNSPSSQERRASDLLLSVLAALGACGDGEQVEQMIDHLRALAADLQERNHQFAIKGVRASQGNRRRLRALAELLARYRGLERALAALDEREPGSMIALRRAVAAVRSGISTRCGIRIKFHPDRAVFPDLPRRGAALKYHPYRRYHRALSSLFDEVARTFGKRMKLYCYG